MDNRHDNNDNRPSDVSIKVKSPFLIWLENFFYHYKWHTIACLFVVIVGAICIFQMCNKPSYDAYIMYAGGANISKTAEKDQQPDYIKIKSALMQYAEDFDKNGERSVHFLNLYLPSTKDFEDLKEQDKNPLDYEALYREDLETYEYQMSFGGEFYIMLLSEELFLKECKEDIIPFNEIATYTNGNAADYEYANEYGIYLHSTELYEKAGFELLPEDTVIVMKAPLLNGKTNQNYERSDIMMRELLKKG